MSQTPKWRALPLGELVQFRNGKLIKPGGEGVYPVYGSNGIIGATNEGMYANAIILGRVGAYCGSVEYCKGPFWASDNAIVVVPLPDRLNVLFAYYLLCHANLNRHAGGAAQPLLTQSRLRPLEFAIPDVDQQARIASILAAHDDIIENNTRRIAILEEMARRIFDFALVRPAADDTVFKQTPVRSLVEMTLGGDWGAEIATGNEVNEVRVIRGTDFRRITAGDFSTSPTRFVSDASLGRRRLRPFDLVVENSINAKSRAAGMPLLVTPGVLRALGEHAVATSFCRQFRCKDRAETVVLFHYLHWLRQRGLVEEYQVVAANGIANFQTEQFMARAQIPLERDEIKRLGEELLSFDPTVLRQQISILRAQRDLLLPKLISGEIDLNATSASLKEAAE